jgi:hypothetical protein
MQAENQLAQRFADMAMETLEHQETHVITKPTLLQSCVELINIYMELGAESHNQHKIWEKAKRVWHAVDTRLPPIDSSTSSELEKDIRHHKLHEVHLQAVLGDMKRATTLARSLLSELEDNEGPVNDLTLLTLAEYTSLLSKTGFLETAEPLIRRLCISHESLYGPKHFITGSTIERMAGLLVVQAKFDEADALYTTAWENAVRVLGPSHPAAQIIRAKMAVILAVKGDSTRSVDIFTRALKVMEGAYGLSHPEVLKLRANLETSISSQ